MAGGAGRDKFIFDTTGNDATTDMIVDFEPSYDDILIKTSNPFEISDAQVSGQEFYDLMQNAYDQTGPYAGAVLTFGDDTIVLLGVSVSELQAGDVLFA